MRISTHSVFDGPEKACALRPGRLGLALALLWFPGVAAAQDSGETLPAIEPPRRARPIVPPTMKGIQPADALRVVSIDPAAGEIASVSSGGTLTRENSIEVVFEYDLVSSPEAVVSAELRSPAAGPVTSIETSPHRIYDDRGWVSKRLAISCGPDSPDRIGELRIRYWMYVPGGRRLVERERPLPHTVSCFSPDLSTIQFGPRLDVEEVTPPVGQITSVVSGASLTGENSLEIVLRYRTDRPAFVMAELVARQRPLGPLVIGRLTSTGGTPIRVSPDQGRVRMRLGLGCRQDAPNVIRDLRIRYRMYVRGGSTLFADERPLPHEVLCVGTDRRAAPGRAATPGDPPPPFQATPPSPEDVERDPARRLPADSVIGTARSSSRHSSRTPPRSGCGSP